MTQTSEKDLALTPETKVTPPAAAKQFNAILGIEPTTIKEALEMAKILSDSDLVPKDFKGKPGNVLIAWEMSNALGIPAVQGIQNIAVINGRASIWGELGTAIVRAHPLTEYLQMSTLDDVKKNGKAWTRHKRKDEPKEVLHEYSFSKEDAVTAGLWNKQGPWKQYPFWMLQMRSNSFCFKISAADMLKGLSIAEEARDIIDVTPESDTPLPKRASSKPAAEPESTTKPAGDENHNGLKKAVFKVKKVTKTSVADEVQVNIYPDAEGAAKYITPHEGIGDLAKKAKSDGTSIEVWFDENGQDLVIEEAKLLASSDA